MLEFCGFCVGLGKSTADTMCWSPLLRFLVHRCSPRRCDVLVAVAAIHRPHSDSSVAAATHRRDVLVAGWRPSSPSRRDS